VEINQRGRAFRNRHALIYRVIAPVPIFNRSAAPWNDDRLLPHGNARTFIGCLFLNDLSEEMTLHVRQRSREQIVKEPDSPPINN
jgi:hypothetical protein